MDSLGFHCQRLRHLESGVLANGLLRGEFYNFPEEELPILKETIRSHGLAMSIHTPLAKIDWYPSPPTWTFLCDADRERRELSFRMVAETMGKAKEFGADYVVVHFPSPDSTGLVRGFKEEQEIALESGYRLACLSQEHGIPTHIEGFGPTPLLSPSFLGEVITRFPSLRYCFDSGHMHIASLRDGFDLYRFARDVAPYVGSLHLWNNRGLEDYLAFRHIPVHPTQSPEEGWADIPRLVKTLWAPGWPIIFESGHHYPPALGDFDYRDGVQWVKSLVSS